MIPDIGCEEIRHQGDPAQANGGNQDSIYDGGVQA